MNLYKKIKKRLWILVAMSMRLHSQQPITSIQQEQEVTSQLDPMQDFAYPVSIIQKARQDLNQALFSVQQQNFDQAASLLQNAIDTLQVKGSQELSPDDEQHIAQMIAQITAIINTHKNEQRALIEDLCQQITRCL